MRIGLHGKEFIEESIPYIKEIIEELNNRDVEILYSSKFARIITSSSLDIDTSNNYESLQENNAPDYVFSIGGDGTLLETVTQVQNLDIPILGINTGRLGFLATIAKKNISSALETFFNQSFTIEERSLLRLETNENLFGKLNYAMNEVAVIKKDTSAMIKVNCSIDDQFLNTYWADGLMISTPTGSTGYSLSCGGPIILPQSKSFLITPDQPT